MQFRLHIQYLWSHIIQFRLRTRFFYSTYGYVLLKIAMRVCSLDRISTFVPQFASGKDNRLYWEYAWFPQYEGLFHMIALASLLIMGQTCLPFSRKDFIRCIFILRVLSTGTNSPPNLFSLRTQGFKMASVCTSQSASQRKVKQNACSLLSASGKHVNRVVMVLLNCILLNSHM